MQFSIITATYNRADTLKRLYESLCKQTQSNFVWVIVDDGSSDTTDALVNRWMHEAAIPIKYIYQENSGKHRAINLGMQSVQSTWAAIVDSDDWLTNDCLERASYFIDKYQLSTRKDVAGLVFLSKDMSGTIVGDKFPFDVYEGKTYSYYEKYKLKGDKFDFYKVAALKEFPFPEIEGEKFISEGVSWNRINKKYKTLFVNEAHQYVEYQLGGLSDSSLRIRSACPKGACLCYREGALLDVGVYKKSKYIINYYRFLFKIKVRGVNDLFPSGVPFYFVFAIPLGLIAHLIDRVRLDRS